MAASIRRSAVAGAWYPGDARALRREVEAHLAEVTSAAPAGRLIALIAPHAGLVYSGPVAAWGYALLRGMNAPATVVLVGPSHRSAFDGVAVMAHGSFETPLGLAGIDDELAAALMKADARIVDRPLPHRDEHSLEMQLPFVQHLLPSARIVPLLMGRQARAEVDALAAALASTLAGRDVLLVASSDLSHYQPAAVAHQLDAEVVARVDAFDADGLMDLLEAAPDHACGGGPMVAVMNAAAALGAKRAAVLRYADSGDAASRDKSRVVGYLSAALLGPV